MILPTAPGLIVPFAGPTCVGKTTFLEILCRTLNAKLLLSNTTRQRRDTDLEGEYTYGTHDQFQEAHASGLVCWHAQVRDDTYWTLNETVTQALQSNTGHRRLYVGALVLVDEGIDKLYAYAHKNGVEDRVKPVYLWSNNYTALFSWMEKRRYSPDKIDLNLKLAREWNALAAEYSTPPLHIINADRSLEEVEAEVVEYVLGFFLPPQ